MRFTIYPQWGGCGYGDRRDADSYEAAVRSWVEDNVSNPHVALRLLAVSKQDLVARQFLATMSYTDDGDKVVTVAPLVDYDDESDV